MARQALGLIETAGLVAAIEAADAAVKSADVKLIGYELTRGGGWTVVKIVGDVAAVQAAVQAARAAAGGVGKVVATHVIPRPHEDSALLVETGETVGSGRSPSCPGKKAGGKAEADVPAAAVCGGEAFAPEEPWEAAPGERAVSEAATAPASVPAAAAVKEEQPKEETAPGGEATPAARVPTCNLCNDPACPRKKGEPRSYCLHYGGEG